MNQEQPEKRQAYVSMMPVGKQPGGTWVIDEDGPLLDCDDFTWLHQVEHRPQGRGTVNGVECTIYAFVTDGESACGYVRAEAVYGPAPTPATEEVAWRGHGRRR